MIGTGVLLNGCLRPPSDNFGISAAAFQRLPKKKHRLKHQRNVIFQVDAGHVCLDIHVDTNACNAFNVSCINLASK